MTKNNNLLALRATSFMILFALVLGTVAPAFGQRRTTRRTVRRTTPARTAPAPTPPPVRYYTVPADTVIRVRMDQQLTSKSARVGDRFTTTVTEPVYSGNGTEVMPVGSKVMGRITSVKKAGRREPGQINVSFYQVELPGGARHTINGSLTTLEADDVNADNEGGVGGRNDRKRDAVFIGGGAGVGAIIGGIAGGGKGAGIGAIIGGALGTGARVYEREEEAEVRSGTQFGIILNRAVTLPASRL
ncbi:MAG TPA: hypothetical protein VEY09_19600 [Pyrinomonadaceae bacterium]|nr:hypothetical protein [Pyrinomonadaceae bacterium]